MRIKAIKNKEIFVGNTIKTQLGVGLIISVNNTNEKEEYDVKIGDTVYTFSREINF